jgi:hypothetical protein
VHLSFSKLSRLAKCPRDYYLHYIDRDPEADVINGAGLAGRAVHQAIEEAEPEHLYRVKAEPQDPEAPLTTLVRKHLAAVVDEAGGPEAPQIRWGGRSRVLRDDAYQPMTDADGNPIKAKETFTWWWYEAPRMMRRYGAVRRGDEKAGAEITEATVEFKVGVNLDTPAGPEHVVGYVDAALLISPTGERVVRDWKTGSFTDPFQLAIYGYLTAEAKGWAVERGEFGELRRSDGEVLKVHDLRPMLPLVAPRFADLAATLRVYEQAQVWPWNPGMLCPSCGSRPRCPWGQTLRGD